MRYTPLVKNQPTQKTAKGYEIPIPKEADFERLVNRAANTQVKPKRASVRRTRRPKK